MTDYRGEFDFFAVVKGDYYDAVEFQFFEEDGVTPIDISGAVIRMDLQGQTTGRRPKRYSTGGGGFTITDSANGTFQLDGHIVDIPAEIYDHDLEITLVTGEPLTYLKGEFTVYQDVTYDNS